MTAATISTSTTSANILKTEGIPWPLTEDGRLSTEAKVFDDLSKGHQQLEGLRQLKHIRDKMRSVELAVGGDDRNRTVLWPYKAKSGRTQPAASAWAFSPAVWMRNLIEPAEGMAISYVDYSSMEFLIAAAKSRDPLMLKFYENDPYLSFAKHVGATPSWATKHTHGPLRDRYKTGLLAIQYGVACVTLAAKLGVSQVAAQAMIDQHHELFSTYWTVGRGLARLDARPRDHVDAHRLAMRRRRRRAEDSNDHQLARPKPRRRYFEDGVHLGDQARTKTMRAGSRCNSDSKLRSTVSTATSNFCATSWRARPRSCSAGRRCAPTRRPSAIRTTTPTAAATRSGSTSPACSNACRDGRNERAGKGETLRDHDGGREGRVGR